MSAAYRTDATAGDGSTATTASLPIVIPAAAAIGDVAVLCVSLNTNPTVTTPTGWTLLSGQDTASTSNASYVWSKTLVSGDPGSTVTLAISAANKVVAEMAIVSGATATGIQIARTFETVVVTSTTTPSITSVPAGAAVIAFFCRRSVGTPGPDVAAPTGYTAGSRAVSNVSTGAQVSIETDYKIAATAGTYGGDAVTCDSSVGSDYLVIVPATASARSGKAKVWSGSAWVSHPAKTWTGSAWAIHPLKAYDGSAFTTAK